jgi:hypothetical protein
MLRLGIGEGGIATVMTGVIIGYLILAIPIGIGVSAALWRYLRVKSRIGRDRWSGQSDIGFGPQIRRADLGISAERIGKYTKWRSHKASTRQSMMNGANAGGRRW